MGTAVMQAQDCLSPYEGLTGAVYRAPAKPKSKSPSRKKSQQEKKRPLKSEVWKRSVKSQNCQPEKEKSNVKEQGKNNMVMEQVTILKRGETVGHAISPPKAEFAAAGFEPATFIKMSNSKPRTEKWAGPAFANSPSPSCLPLPKFSFNKMAAPAEEKVLTEEDLVRISATRDLRRLLGLV
ncbi:hypothetical protein SUGI_0887120 [Cryptomeria japonica]|uniref:uncharacterized protein LOC131067756 n=1 Tax=Cryptomeria japonica TaxID=3369 RepID=UPI002414AE10|nr:uncharacterized protein LOC131067756 [Cryptomeria japonica]GLJ42781.1 hypothetical protein SUGI_0887120 [Cryptomeria japonica]